MTKEKLNQISVNESVNVSVVQNIATLTSVPTELTVHDGCSELRRTRWLH